MCSKHRCSVRSRLAGARGRRAAAPGPGQPAVVGLGALPGARVGVALDEEPAHGAAVRAAGGDQVGDDGRRRDRLVGQSLAQCVASAAGSPVRAAGSSYLGEVARYSATSASAGKVNAVGFVDDLPDAQAGGGELLDVAAVGGLVQARPAGRCGVEAGGGDQLVEFPVAVGRLDRDDRRPARGRQRAISAMTLAGGWRVVEAERGDDQVAGCRPASGQPVEVRAMTAPARAAAGSRLLAAVSSAADRSTAIIRACGSRPASRRVVVPRPHPMSATRASLGPDGRGGEIGDDLGSVPSADAGAVQGAGAAGEPVGRGVERPADLARVGEGVSGGPHGRRPPPAAAVPRGDVGEVAAGGPAAAQHDDLGVPGVVGDQLAGRAGPSSCGSRGCSGRSPR